MWTRDRFLELIDPGVIGMVHLPPLPGSPRWDGDWTAVLEAARTDAEALAAGGVGGVMVENFLDAPFYPDRVPPVTIAAMTRAVLAVAEAAGGLPVGVNVLRNDAVAALSVAAATGAAFIRINVHVGAAVTDQGLISGRAWQTMRLRRELGTEVGVLADVRVKHARPLAERPVTEEVRDLRLRGLADGVIVTGAATGSAADPELVREVRAAVPGCPVLVGSGVDADSAPQLAAVADGVIVGTSLKESDAGGRLAVSAARTRQLVAAFVPGAGQGEGAS